MTIRPAWKVDGCRFGEDRGKKARPWDVARPLRYRHADSLDPAQCLRSARHLHGASGRARGQVRPAARIVGRQDVDDDEVGVELPPEAVQQPARAWDQVRSSAP